MLLTENAVTLLKRGAFSGSLDVNAIGIDKEGKDISYYANQFIWEENPGSEDRIDLEDFQPVLEVR